MLHNLDNTDAVVFIYNKTLTEIYGQNPATNMMTNILSISDNENYTGNDFMKCNKALETMASVSNTLLWFNNEKLSTFYRMKLVETHLHTFFTFFVEYSLDVFFPFFEFIQSKIEPMTYEEYSLFLKTLAKYIQRAVKRQQIPTKDNVWDACFLLQAQYRGKTVSQIGEEEGWKSPIEELVKLIF
jgi:hypothetical protein